MLDYSEKQRVHNEPRISANQLAEYTLASPTRRQAIIRNAKYPPIFLVIRYSEARESICDYLSDATRPVAKLHKAEFRLKEFSETAPTDFKANDALLSAEAIKSFADFVSDPRQCPNTFSKLTFETTTNRLPKLQISGVSVSVQLDLVSKNVTKGKIGGVVIQTSKGIAKKSWREDHSACVASMVWMLASKHMNKLGNVDKNLCYSIDLFAKKVTRAPANFKRRLSDIEASCAEISALWPSVSPPAGYSEQ